LVTDWISHEGRPLLFRLAWRSLRNARKCLTWAWLDTVCQYRRSRIGPLWETLNALVMITGITLVSSAVIGGDMIDLLGYVGLGIIVWTAISSTIIEGATTFVRNASAILSSNVSIDLYVGRTVFKVFIGFGHQFVLYFLGVALKIIPISFVSLLAVPGLILLFLNSYWVVMSLGFICARYRDVELIIRNLLQLAFFVTPVFWRPELIASDRRFIVDYNVLFYSIELVREPLLGRMPPTRYYLIVVCVTIAGYLLTSVVYRRMRRRISYFV
jgi:ABC-type polysaccharide/polyol phosphate export permease